MDKFVRKIELPLAKKIVENAGLYIVPKSRIKELARIAADAYEDYPLHNWFSGGKYEEYIAEKNYGNILETNKESNVSLYQHFGFELSKKEFIPKTSVMHYAMVRKPSLENEEGGEK